jgi:hypothetical protein
VCSLGRLRSLQSPIELPQPFKSMHSET